MTADDRFDHSLMSWLESMAPASAPVDLHEGLIERARGRSQRPAWLAILRVDTLAGSFGLMARPALRVGFVLVIFALLIAILAAISGGTRRTDLPSLGRNGAIAYEVQDISLRPYNHGHLLGTDGSGDRLIGQASCLTFSRSGTVLAYRTGWAETAQLTIARPDGSDPVVVSGIGDSDYALSPDGTRIAWFKWLSPITSPDTLTTIGAQTELWVTQVSGGSGVRIVSTPSSPNEWYSFPRWSPDGARLAFAINTSVFTAGNSGAYRSAIDVVGADGSNLQRLTARPGTDFVGLSWSPDSRSIAYVGLPDGSPLPSLDAGSGSPVSFYPPQDVFVIGADGTGDTNLTSSAAEDINPSWSPDGAFLAYQAFDGSAYRLATIPMTGRAAAGPPNLGPRSDGVVWSPDGTKLLWYTGHVRDATAGTQTSVSSVGYVDPQFRRPATTLMTVPYNLGNSGCPPSWQRVDP